MTSFQPRRGLEDRVLSIDVVESDGGDISVLPGTGAVLGFQLRGRVRAEHGLLATAGITGVQSSARRYQYLGETASILVRFTAQGVACFGVPASELAGRSVALDDLFPAARVRALRGRLHDARTVGERVACVEAFLCAQPFAEDRLVARAMQALSGNPGEPEAVARVARALGLSERQLERRFLQRIGVSPKRYAGLVRFERALELVRRAPSLTRAALDAGYYDQSHFIREFRRFAGVAPGRFAGLR